MDFSPYFRNRPNATVGVLLVHGIVSSPRHFDFLIDHIPDKYEVHSLLLAGHGGSVSDFSKATAKQWHDQVETALSALEARCETVYIIGHSLGALLTLTALKNGHRPAGVLLLNPALLPQLKPAMARRSLCFALGRVNTENPVERMCYEDLGVQLDPCLLKYLGWIPNFWSLLTLAAKCRPIPASLTLPCYAFIGQKDELVRPTAIRYLNQNPYITTEILEAGVHFGYAEPEQKRIIQAMNKMFSGEKPGE